MGVEGEKEKKTIAGGGRRAETLRLALLDALDGLVEDAEEECYSLHVLQPAVVLEQQKQQPLTLLRHPTTTSPLQTTDTF